MSKKKNYLISIIFIFILAFFAGNFSYPKYFNRGADYINSKLNIQDSKFRFPRFPEIPFKLGLDLQGGIHLIYEADLKNVEKKDYSSVMEGLRDVIERRVDLFGVREPLVQIQGERLIIELAGVIDPARAIEEIGKTPFLEFREQKSEEEIKKIQEKIEEIKGKSLEEAKEVEDWQLALEEPFQSTALTGKYLKKAELGFDQTTSKPLVLLQFDEEGSKIFEELTSKNTGKYLAIYIDDNLISAPVVQETISGGRAQITGNFTIGEAKELVQNLNAGALPVPIKLTSQQTVGPILGKISLSQSLKAGILGFFAILLFMIIFYRVPGIFASISLLIYIALILSLFKLIPVTLTLAGIAGFLLSMGMAVDANILIFSRTREELKISKNLLISIEQGFKRAWPAIRDGNFTTILIGLILFGLGTSFVKGFAFTLVIGNLVGMFSSIFITNNLLKIFSKDKFLKWYWLWR